MKAVMAYGPRDFRVETLPTPDADGGAVIRVEAAGVCAADRMIFNGVSPWTLSFPFVPGHEFVGTIESVSPQARERWAVGKGDRVTAEVIVPCDKCHLCRSGRYHLCRHGAHLGSALPGGWAEFMALPPRARVWRIPDALEPWQAVLAEPLSCAVHAVARADITSDDVVAVVGVGAIGAATLTVAALKRPRTLIALVRSGAKAELARRLGADLALDPFDVVAARIAEATDGHGVDTVIEMSGSTDGVALALDVVAPGGSVVLYGVYPPHPELNLNMIAEFKELDVRGGHLSPGAFPEAIRLLADGSFDCATVVTHRFPLEQFEQAINPADGGVRMKTVIEPPRSDGLPPVGTD